ncbi:hypothetical protein HY29_16610 [Hyphomonas beringensis]|uniref:Uncharacterized protein n=1 Tax=Hyphomonas beringensis TaxID=1280946 RepID=A0A062U014_9PROT|nr:hypothetical protein [Hyphomonas beringensis]KCZ53641.1 hypothetical protein HY29_16610 [Hyphomonas beringensis]
MTENKTVRRHWERPPLPAGHQGGGVIGGWLLICLGITIVIYASSFELEGLGLAMFGIGLSGLGFLSITISLILREIRRIAFEAALRSGEVEIEERAPRKFLGK